MSNPTSQPENRNPFATRWFALSAVGLAIILAGLLIIGYNYWFVREDPQPAAPKTASGPCGLPTSDQTDITAIPKTGWRIIGTGAASMSVPVSEAAGPSDWEAGLPGCWQQSPTGAVLAASTFAALSSIGHQHTLYNEYTVDGAARDKALAETPVDEDIYSTGVNLEGFRLVNYTKERAQIEVVAGGSPKGQQVHVAVVIDLVHQGGDWKYDPPTTLEPPAKAVPDLSGFTEFKKD